MTPIEPVQVSSDSVECIEDSEGYYFRYQGGIQLNYLKSEDGIEGRKYASARLLQVSNKYGLTFLSDSQGVYGFETKTLYHNIDTRFQSKDLARPADVCLFMLKRENVTHVQLSADELVLAVVVSLTMEEDASDDEEDPELTDSEILFFSVAHIFALAKSSQSMQENPKPIWSLRVHGLINSFLWNKSPSGPVSRMFAILSAGHISLGCLGSRLEPDAFSPGESFAVATGRGGVILALPPPPDEAPVLAMDWCPRPGCTTAVLVYSTGRVLRFLGLRVIEEGLGGTPGALPLVGVESRALEEVAVGNPDIEEIQIESVAWVWPDLVAMSGTDVESPTEEGADGFTQMLRFTGSWSFLDERAAASLTAMAAAAAGGAKLAKVAAFNPFWVDPDAHGGSALCGPYLHVCNGAPWRDTLVMAHSKASDSHVQIGQRVLNPDLDADAGAAANANLNTVANSVMVTEDALRIVLPNLPNDNRNYVLGMAIDRTEEGPGEPLNHPLSLEEPPLPPPMHLLLLTSDGALRVFAMGHLGRLAGPPLRVQSAPMPHPDPVLDRLLPVPDDDAEERKSSDGVDVGLEEIPGRVKEEEDAEGRAAAKRLPSDDFEDLDDAESEEEVTSELRPQPAALAPSGSSSGALSLPKPAPATVSPLPAAPTASLFKLTIEKAPAASKTISETPAAAIFKMPMGMEGPLVTSVNASPAPAVVPTPAVRLPAPAVAPAVPIPIPEPAAPPRPLVGVLRPGEFQVKPTVPLAKIENAPPGPAAGAVEQKLKRADELTSGFKAMQEGAAKTKADKTVGTTAVPSAFQPAFAGLGKGFEAASDVESRFLSRVRDVVFANAGKLANLSGTLASPAEDVAPVIGAGAARPADLCAYQEYVKVSRDIKELGEAFSKVKAERDEIQWRSKCLQSQATVLEENVRRLQGELPGGGTGGARRGRRTLEPQQKEALMNLRQEEWEVRARRARLEALVESVWDERRRDKADSSCAGWSQEDERTTAASGPQDEELTKRAKEATPVGRRDTAQLLDRVRELRAAVGDRVLRAADLSRAMDVQTGDTASAARGSHLPEESVSSITNRLQKLLQDSSRAPAAAAAKEYSRQFQTPVSSPLPDRKPAAAAADSVLKSDGKRLTPMTLSIHYGILQDFDSEERKAPNEGAPGDRAVESTAAGHLPNFRRKLAEGGYVAESAGTYSRYNLHPTAETTRHVDRPSATTGARDNGPLADLTRHHDFSDFGSPRLRSTIELESLALRPQRLPLPPKIFNAAPELRNQRLEASHIVGKTLTNLLSGNLRVIVVSEISEETLKVRRERIQKLEEERRRGELIALAGYNHVLDKDAAAEEAGEVRALTKPPNGKIIDTSSYFPAPPPAPEQQDRAKTASTSLPVTAAPPSQQQQAPKTAARSLAAGMFDASTSGAPGFSLLSAAPSLKAPRSTLGGGGLFGTGPPSFTAPFPAATAKPDAPVAAPSPFPGTNLMSKLAFAAGPPAASPIDKAGGAASPALTLFASPAFSMSPLASSGPTAPAPPISLAKVAPPPATAAKDTKPPSSESSALASASSSSSIPPMPDLAMIRKAQKAMSKLNAPKDTPAAKDKTSEGTKEDINSKPAATKQPPTAIAAEKVSTASPAGAATSPLFGNASSVNTTSFGASPTFATDFGANLASASSPSLTASSVASTTPAAVTPAVGGIAAGFGTGLASALPKFPLPAAATAAKPAGPIASKNPFSLLGNTDDDDDEKSENAATKATKEGGKAKFAPPPPAAPPTGVLLAPAQTSSPAPAFGSTASSLFSSLSFASGPATTAAFTAPNKAAPTAAAPVASLTPSPTPKTAVNMFANFNVPASAAGATTSIFAQPATSGTFGFGSLTSTLGAPPVAPQSAAGFGQPAAGFGQPAAVGLFAPQPTAATGGKTDPFTAFSSSAMSGTTSLFGPGSGFGVQSAFGSGNLLGGGLTPPAVGTSTFGGLQAPVAPLMGAPAFLSQPVGGSSTFSALAQQGAATGAPFGGGANAFGGGANAFSGGGNAFSGGGNAFSGGLNFGSGASLMSGSSGAKTGGSSEMWKPRK